MPSDTKNRVKKTKARRLPKVRIALPFDKAVEGLLAVRPEKTKRKSG